MRAFPFVMIGAMYENGGNTTQRTLDGHSELFVYPYESQPGTRFVQDSFSSMFPLKYRWPVFPMGASAAECYEFIIDEEAKVRTKTPFVSKFRNASFEMSDRERKALFVEYAGQGPHTSTSLMAAFFRATFDAWKDFRRSGKNRIYVGYSPIITIDTQKILDENAEAQFIHVVRNPYSAYADTKKRAVPLSLKNYIGAWVVNQHYALQYKKQYGSRFHLVRFEDLVQDKRATLKPLCAALGISADDPALDAPSWNSQLLEEVYPWGTIRKPTPEVNLATANELSSEEKAEVALRSEPFLSLLGYADFLKV